MARPPSASYQLQKFVARHKVTASFIGAILVLLVAFGVGMTVLYRRSEANRLRAVTAERSSAQNFDLARGAVDRYLTRVGESPELRAEGLEELRRQLLGTAREFYENLARQQGRQAGLGSELASSHHRLADISRSLGDQQGAESEYRRALDALGRFQEAAGQWDEAIRYDDRGDSSLREARDASRAKS